MKVLEVRGATHPIGFDAMVKVVADYTLDTLGNQLVMREHEEHGKYLILSTTVMGDRIL